MVEISGRSVSEFLGEKNVCGRRNEGNLGRGFKDKWGTETGGSWGSQPGLIRCDCVQDGCHRMGVRCELAMQSY